jgi:hypothetical protein
MIAIIIGAAVSGFVLGATSRIIFLLPAALMALIVAAVLVVRADIDLGFTALAATLLNSGFLLGIVMAPVMSRLFISRRGTVDEAAAGFVVRDRHGRALACVGFSDGRPEADSLLTHNEAWEIATNFNKHKRGHNSSPTAWPVLIVKRGQGDRNASLTKAVQRPKWPLPGKTDEHREPDLRRAG